VVRRLTRVLGFPPSRSCWSPPVADWPTPCKQSGLAVVHVEGAEGVAAIPQALEALYSGYFSP